jgi:multidrug efflux pump subunit AcrA (membrane-fusion protein)
MTRTTEVLILAAQERLASIEARRIKAKTVFVKNSDKHRKALIEVDKEADWAERNLRAAEEKLAAAAALVEDRRKDLERAQASVRLRRENLQMIVDNIDYEEDCLNIKFDRLKYTTEEELNNLVKMKKWEDECEAQQKAQEAADHRERVARYLAQEKKEQAAARGDVDAFLGLTDDEDDTQLPPAS